MAALTGVGTIQGHDPELAQHQVPGDMTSSIIIASMAATAAGQGPSDGPHITHGSGYNSSPLSIKQLITYACDYFRSEPFTELLFVMLSRFAMCHL